MMNEKPLNMPISAFKDLLKFVSNGSGSKEVYSIIEKITSKELDSSSEGHNFKKKSGVGGVHQFNHGY